MIHTIKGFSIVNEAEVYVFLESPSLFYDPVDVGNLISDSSAAAAKSRLTLCNPIDGSPLGSPVPGIR